MVNGTLKERMANVPGPVAVTARTEQKRETMTRREQTSRPGRSGLAMETASIGDGGRPGPSGGGDWASPLSWGTAGLKPRGVAA